MNGHFHCAAGLAVLVMALAGCSSSDSTNESGGSDMNDLAGMLDRPKPVASDEPAATDQASPAEQPKRDAAATPQPPAQDERPHAVEVVPPTADAPQAVGRRQYRNTVGGPLRYYGAIATARSVILDDLLYAQIKKSMDLYEATNARYPSSTEEFMDKIIRENMIQLPELPPGQEYFYDPSDHELKIGQLARQPAEGDPSPQP